MHISSPQSAHVGRPTPLPLYLCRARAGFPSPADDYVEDVLALDDLLVSNEDATFFAWAEGDSMTGANIQSGDLLIIDRSLNPGSGDIVVAALGGELTVKRLEHKHGQLRLLPENESYDPIEVTIDLHVWGIVTHVIHEMQ